ncbi:MAG TPA: EamA/RhaT family transporter, partial [Rhizobium sp.]|nr:EamA/RhaT family transporter [Rhizobium sp.]
EIIAATVLGYALFGEFPDASKWTGVAIIVGSGLFILWREQKRAKRAAI